MASCSSRDPSYRVLTNETINKAVLEAEYAVRGKIPIRAEQLRDELENGKQLPFDKVVSCNIGNPQQLDQKPLTYLRQVSRSGAALLSRPFRVNGAAHRPSFMGTH